MGLVYHHISDLQALSLTHDVMEHAVNELRTRISQLLQSCLCQGRDLLFGLTFIYGDPDHVVNTHAQ